MSSLTIDSATPSKRRWQVGPATILGGWATIHFAVSVYLWIGYFRFELSGRGLTRGMTAYYLSCAGPCVVLLLLSLACTVLGLTRKRIAWKMLLLLAILSIALFWYDVSRKRYQFDVFVATTEYWQSGGKRYEYATWWWYNDRWFPKPAPSQQPLAFTPATRPTMTVAQQVDYLIDTIAKLENATFIRNGAEYTAANAATLLQYRWNRDKEQLKTAEEFIRKAATQSSTTGQPYLIRFSDGTEVRSEQYLRKKLEEFAK